MPLTSGCIPTNPDIVIVPTIVTWKSTDGGRTFTAIRGAPGGDDYQRAWFNPNNPDIIAMTSDQGAVITLNGGESWSSWYNQPTAAFYHVSTDNSFPYRVCSGQQESGSVCIQSRGDDGQITFREWSPVGVEEYGYVAPDPLDPDIVYGGKVSRWDRRTRQVQQVGPRFGRPADYRVVRTMPVLFSPVNPRKLYFSSNVLWQTINGGRSWDQISPDLTRKSWEIPRNVGVYSSSAGSAIDAARRDLHDRAVVPRRADDLGRHRRRAYSRHARRRQDVERRHAAGADAVGEGVDHGRVALRCEHGVRGDQHLPPRRSAAAHLSHPRWRQDMDPHHQRHSRRRHRQRRARGSRSGAACCLPAPSRPSTCRSTTAITGSRCATTCRRRRSAIWSIKDDDLVVGTHGRSFYILDDITPLRQVDAATDGRRHASVRAAGGDWRFRWNKNTDTPLPPDEPAGQNPPDGAIVHYCLKSAGEDACRSRSSTRRAVSSAATPATIRSNRSSKAATRPITGSARIALCRRPRACIASCGTCTTSGRR